MRRPCSSSDAGREGGKSPRTFTRTNKVTRRVLAVESTALFDLFFMTPRTEKYKAQGREWLPLGIFEDVERENSRLREALDRIARPVWWMQEDQKRKTGSINGISGGMAVALSDSAEYLKGIARDALSNASSLATAGAALPKP